MKSRAPVGSERIIIVVSISQKPRSTKKLRMKFVTSWRSRMISLDRSRRRSMYVSSPWSRRVCTQPASVTSFPASEARASPQVCVRNTYVVPPNLSASGLETRSRLVVSLVTAEPLLARSIPIVLEEWRLAGCPRLVLVRVGGALEEWRRHVLRHVAADLGHD